MKLYIFDFDGVLAIPYTNPESYYKHIPTIIPNLSKDNYLAVASFNLRAKIAVEEWGLLHYFKAIRYGSNSVWDNEYNDNYRKDMSKSKQIQNMLENELKDIVFDEIIFYDDDIKNILDVRNVSNVRNIGITSVLVDELNGLTICMDRKERILQLEKNIKMLEEEKKIQEDSS